MNKCYELIRGEKYTFFNKKSALRTNCTCSPWFVPKNLNIFKQKEQEKNLDDQMPSLNVTIPGTLAGMFEDPVNDVSSNDFVYVEEMKLFLIIVILYRVIFLKVL